MKKLSINWFLLGGLDLATMVTGGILWTGYQHTWGLPIALLGLSGLALAAYEILKKDEKDEEAVEAELNSLKPPSE